MNAIARALLNRILGDQGERAAGRHLRRRGMRVIIRGFRTPSGEIDLIARDGDVLVFVEVKSRRKGSPAEAVNLEKQRRISRAAAMFLKREGLSDVRHRFDVVAIIWPDDRKSPSIEHFENAFEACEPGEHRRH